MARMTELRARPRSLRPASEPPSLRLWHIVSSQAPDTFCLVKNRRLYRPPFWNCWKPHRSLPAAASARWCRFDSLDDQSEVGDQRRDRPQGGQHRRRDHADRGYRQRDLDKRVPLLILHDNAANISFANEFAYLVDELLPPDLELFVDDIKIYHPCLNLSSSVTSQPRDRKVLHSTHTFKYNKQKSRRPAQIRV